jgi:hypothetical protein
MQIVAAIYARTVRHYIGTSYNAETRSLVDAPKAEYVAGSLIGFVVESSTDGALYLMNDEKTKVYGEGAYLAPALKMRSRATIVARRHFGPDVIVA